MIDLRLGDCLDILPTLDVQVDAIITDLPYGTTACKWDVVIPFEPMWKQVKRLLKPRGAFVTTASQPFTSLLVCSNIEWFRHELFWDKKNAQNFVRSKYEPRKIHENLLVFASGDTVYHPQFSTGKPYTWKFTGAKHKLTKMSKSGGTSYDMLGIYENDGKRFPTTYISFPRVEGKIHPTQKPVALYEYLIRTYTNEGNTVMDFCMGSGTTGKACMNTGRNFIGIEKDAGYFEIAKGEIEKAQRQLALPMVTA